MSDREKKLIDLLGEPDLEETAGSTGSLKVIQLIRKGITKKSFDEFARKSSLPKKRISSIIHSSERSIQRKLNSQKLSVGSSEKLVQLAQLFALGEEVFGDMILFNKWIENPNIALGGNKPLDMLDTSPGFDLVKEELLRLDFGVYS